MKSLLYVKVSSRRDAFQIRAHCIRSDSNLYYVANFRKQSIIFPSHQDQYHFLRPLRLSPSDLLCPLNRFLVIFHQPQPSDNGIPSAKRSGKANRNLILQHLLFLPQSLKHTPVDQKSRIGIAVKSRTPLESSNDSHSMNIRPTGSKRIFYLKFKQNFSESNPS
jgi:hypothetical protein